MKKKSIIIISILGVIILIIGIIFLTTNKIIINKKEKYQIIDATYNCVKVPEKFFEDDTYIYFFPCAKSKSIYVKFENGNKMLVVDAIDSQTVTIDDLIDVGLDVIKQEK